MQIQFKMTDIITLKGNKNPNYEFRNSQEVNKFRKINLYREELREQVIKVNSYISMSKEKRPRWKFQAESWDTEKILKGTEANKRSG